jgi:hypothetical protein
MSPLLLACFYELRTPKQNNGKRDPFHGAPADMRSWFQIFF